MFTLLLDKLLISKLNAINTYNQSNNNMGCLISLFKTCFKLLDTGIYIADVLSDFANAILYYQNCHFNYFYFSIGTLILSYITTVIYLTFIVHHKEKWYRALFYPYCLMEITWKKFLSHCPFLNDESKKLKVNRTSNDKSSKVKQFSRNDIWL